MRKQDVTNKEFGNWHVKASMEAFGAIVHVCAICPGEEVSEFDASKTILRSEAGMTRNVVRSMKEKYGSMAILGDPGSRVATAKTDTMRFLACTRSSLCECVYLGSSI